jgi:hypothetical protein
MECQHCGFSEAIKMPAPIDAILGEFDAFTAAHIACQRPQSETVMSEYIKGFDAGYDYVLNEILRYANVYKDDKLPYMELLRHLRMEGKPNEQN